MTGEFRKLVADHWTGAANETAMRLLVALKVNKAAAEVLFPVIANAIRDAMRETVRRIEADVNVAAIQTAPAEQRAKFLAQRFPLEDGRFVAWGEATIEDHHARIALLTRIRNGIDDTIGRHELALKLLAEHGADCLNELPPETTTGVAA
jgi:hypothetical protein